MKKRKHFLSRIGVMLLIVCIVFTSQGLTSPGDKAARGETFQNPITKIDRDYTKIQIGSNHKPGETMHVMLCYRSNNTTSCITLNDFGHFELIEVSKNLFPERITSNIKYFTMQYLPYDGGYAWFIYVPDGGWLKSDGGQYVGLTDTLGSATPWELTDYEEGGTYFKDMITGKYLHNTNMTATKISMQIYKKNPGTNRGLSSFWYNYKKDGTVAADAAIVDYNMPGTSIELPCNTDISSPPSITSVHPYDSDASYSVGKPTGFKWIYDFELYRYMSSTIITVTSESNVSSDFTANFYIKPHSLTYTALENVMTENCGTCSHEATATLNVSDAEYSGSEIKNANITYSSGWKGGKLDVVYIDNIFPGRAGAGIIKDNATAYKYFTITNKTQRAPRIGAYTNETIYGCNDGSLRQLNSTMEYRKEGEENYTPVPEGEGQVIIENLSPGKYYVRYKAKEYHDPSPDNTVIIEAGRMLKVTFVDLDAEYIKEVGWKGSLSASDIPSIPIRYGYDNSKSKWDKSLEQLQNIIKDTTVTALYTPLSYNVDLVNGEGYTLTPSDGSKSPVEFKQSYSFELNIKDGYSKTNDFAVIDGNGDGDPSDDYVMTDGGNYEVDGNKYKLKEISRDTTFSAIGIEDVTAPTAEADFNQNGFKTLLNKITFGHFFKENLDVKIKATDAGSGVEKVEYLKADRALSDPTIAPGWAEGDSFSVSENEKFILYVRVTDKAGNTAIYSDGVVVYADSAANTDSINYTLTSGENKLALVTLNGNLISGVRNGDDALVKDTDFEVSGNAITFRASYLEKLDAGNYDMFVSYDPLGVQYVDAEGNDKPIETQIKLAVSKAEQTLALTGLDETYTYGDSSFDVDLDGQKTSGAAIYEIVGDPDVAGVSGNSISILKAGEFRIKGTAPSDDKYSEASVISDKITVNEAVPTVEVTGAEVDHGQNIDLDITVSKPAGSLGNTPEGTVDIKDGEKVIAEDLPLTGGKASYTTDSLPGIGPHDYKVEYSGQTGYYAGAHGSVSLLVKGIKSVDISPGAVSVTKGDTHKFNADVDAVGGVVEDVTWSVSGENDSRTSIDQDGLLTVGPAETAGTLTVTAISDFDKDKKDEAAVTVKEVPFGFVDGSIHKIGDKKELKFRAEKDLALLSDVLINGASLEKEKYQTYSGSTVITLDPKYLDSLDPGKHSLSVEFSDGWKADAQFTVVAADPVVDPSPDDGSDGSGSDDDAANGGTSEDTGKVKGETTNDGDGASNGADNGKSGTEPSTGDHSLIDLLIMICASAAIFGLFAPVLKRRFLSKEI